MEYEEVVDFDCPILLFIYPGIPCVFDGAPEEEGTYGTVAGMI